MKKYNDYLPEFLGVILAFLLLNLWYLSSIAIENKVLPANLEYLYKGVTVLIGAFVGAFAAFKLKSKNDEEIKHTEEKMAMNKAIFVCVRQINAVKNMHKVLSKYSSELDRGFGLPAMKSPCYDDLKYDFDELGFLLEEHPQLVMDLVIEQERFEQAFKSIEIRNEFYINEVQPALSALNLNGKSFRVTDFSNALGERLFEGAINGAKTIYFHIGEADKSIVEIYDKLEAVSREIFPGEKFVRWKSET